MIFLLLKRYFAWVLVITLCATRCRDAFYCIGIYSRMGIYFTFCINRARCVVGSRSFTIKLFKWNLVKRTNIIRCFGLTAFQWRTTKLYTSARRNWNEIWFVFTFHYFIQCFCFSFEIIFCTWNSYHFPSHTQYLDWFLNVIILFIIHFQL